MLPHAVKIVERWFMIYEQLSKNFSALNSAREHSSIHIVVNHWCVYWKTTRTKSIETHTARTPRTGCRVGIKSCRRAYRRRSGCTTPPCSSLARRKAMWCCGTWSAAIPCTNDLSVTRVSFLLFCVDLIIIIELFLFSLVFVAEISCIGVSRDDSLIASGGDDGKCIITKN